MKGIRFCQCSTKRQPKADNTAYTAHFVHPNFCFAKTSFMLGTLGDISLGGKKR